MITNAGLNVTEDLELGLSGKRLGSLQSVWLVTVSAQHVCAPHLTLQLTGSDSSFRVQRRHWCFGKLFLPLWLSWLFLLRALAELYVLHHRLLTEQ